ncbi:MAG: thermonuclease family protein, partial [Thermomicrobiales bacterium]
VYIDNGDGTLSHVILAGIDAPNDGECFYDEAKAKLTSLLPIGTTVYLEASGSVDREDGLPVRYVWVASDNGGKARLINTKLVREGDAGFDSSLDTPKYFENLAEAQDAAQSKDSGVWGACGELHLSTREPIDASFVMEAAAAANAALAKVYSADATNYPDWIAAQTTIVTSSVGQLGLIMASFNEASLTDPAWIDSVNALAGVWKSAYNAAISTTPPAEYAETHAIWVEAMLHYSNAADYLTSGIANYDVTSISSAANELTVGSLYIQEANDAIFASN